MTPRDITRARCAALLALVLVVCAPFVAGPGGASGAGPRHASVGESVEAAYLPIGARHVDFGALPDPAHPTHTPIPTLTPTPVPTATPTEVVCAPLPQRAEVTAVDVSPHEVVVMRSRTAAMPIFLAPLPGGEGSKAAWSDGQGSIHVTPLDREDRRAGDDLLVAGDEVRGLAVHDGGTTMLIVEGENLSLVRIDDAGAPVFDVHMIGGGSQSVAGNKWISSWTHEGRLTWSGDEYGAYVGHTQQFGASGIHQGDLLWFFDGTGARVEDRRDWDWGCSHSLDLRLAHNGTRFGPACLSDSYPSKAFHFNHRTAVIRNEPSGNARGFSAANLGGWVPLADGFLMSFSSPEGRASSDVGLIHVSNDGDIGPEIWLTDTAGIDESAPHLARYGSELLAGWSADDEHVVGVVDLGGAFVEGPTAISPPIAAMDDMVAFPNGDVAWAYAWDDMSELKIVRIPWCGESPVTPGVPTVAPTAELTPTPPGATVTPGPSPTSRPTNPPMTPGPSTCRDLVTNGDFEDTLSDWQHDGETKVRFSDLSGGQYAAMLLGRNNVTAELRQTVTLPGDTVAAHLTYWWRMESGEAEASTRPYDTVRVSAGQDLEVLSNLSGREDWRPSGHYVEPGGTVEIAFRAEANPRDPTEFYLDDVALIACSGSPLDLPRLSVDPLSGPAGTFTGTGTGFGADETVTHWALEPTTLLRFDLATSAASAAGTIQDAFQVRDTSGTWLWGAVGHAGLRPARTIFTVTDAAAGDPAPTGRAHLSFDSPFEKIDPAIQ